MIPIITKTLRIPLGDAAKIEAARGKLSWNAYCVEALREKVEREATMKISGQ